MVDIHNHQTIFNYNSLSFLPAEARALLDELVYVGNTLNEARQTNTGIDQTVKYINSHTQRLGFKLKQKIGTTVSEIGISASKLRVKLNLCKEGSPPVPYTRRKDNVKIKAKDIGQGISFDNNPAYRDNDPNWAVQNSVQDEAGNIEMCATYMPTTGEMFFANKEQAFRIYMPRIGMPITRDLTIPKLRDKFTAEVSSWHKKERSPVKAIFTSLVRHSIGGSLLETGMSEVPFAWVGSGARGYCFIGNLERGAGNVGTHIAELSGAKIFRIPILTDDYGRDAVFALHPKIANHVIDKFYEAIGKSEGDVQIGEPFYSSSGLIIPATPVFA